MLLLMRTSSVVTKSSKRSRRVTLVGTQLPTWTRQLLLDMANGDFLFFWKKWHLYGLRHWLGDEQEFRRSQQLIRAVWAGKENGARVVAQNLGLASSSVEDESNDADERRRSHIYVDWGRGALEMVLLDLNEHLWMALLQQSQKLAICRNSEIGGTPGGSCSTPYFLRYRPQQTFCSQECAEPRQRETKRRWWNSKGKEWLKKRKKLPKS